MIIDNDIIVCKEYNGIQYIQFKKLLEFGIKHAYTLKGENINFRSKSKEEKESYSKIYEAIGLNVNTLVKPLQNHTSNIKCIDRVWKNEDLPNTDGLITDKKEIALTTTNADCILLLFYDPVKKVIANVHSGWKGTFQKIGEKAVIKMITNYKCKPEDIYCFISPSIRKCHFEVDKDVREIFEKEFKDLGNTNLEQIIEKQQEKEKWNIDTVLINKIIMQKLGLKPENIVDSGICTVCNSNLIHSYRAEGKGYGLATALIGLK